MHIVNRNIVSLCGTAGGVGKGSNLAVEHTSGDPFQLDQHVAIVTGGTGGIGWEIGQRFLERGAVVALAGSRPLSDWSDRIDELTTVYPGRVSAHRVDLRSMESCELLVAAVVERHGGVDVLVNNAGINIRYSLVDTTEDDWLRIMDVNLNGTYRMSRSAFPALRESSHASVVNHSSTAGEIAVHRAAAYGVSKAGIIHMTRILALEWAQYGIRVNAVAPSIVPSPMTSDIRADPDLLADKVKTIPLGRMIEPTEVANAVAFLASSGAGSITGHTLFVDGGVVIS